MQYLDMDCIAEFNFYCKIKDFQVFQLKGMCVEKKGDIDRKFVLKTKNTVNGRPRWTGFLSSSIQWNQNKTQWEIINTKSNDTIASMRNKKFPVGEGIWYLELNDICLENPKGNKLTLMLSNCGQYEYSCSDGTCIPIEKKCDFAPNC